MLSKIKGVVLLVEDVPTDLRDLSEKIATFGYEVIPANSAQEALRLFTQHRWRIDVCLIDWVLGESSSMDGLELTKKLSKLRRERGYSKRPELICLTSLKINGQDENKVKDAGAHYLRKGLIDSYLTALDAAMDRIQKYRTRGPKIVVRHAVSVPAVDTVPYREFCLKSEGTTADILLVGPAGPKVVPIVGEVNLIFLDLLAYLSHQKPKSWKNIVEQAESVAFFSTQLQREKRTTDTSRDNFKMIIYRIRSALTLAAIEAKLPFSGDDILMSYAIDPVSGAFRPLEEKADIRDSVSQLRRRRPETKSYIVEDKKAYLKLVADCDVEEFDVHALSLL